MRSLELTVNFRTDAALSLAVYATLVLRKQQTLAKAEVRAERGLLNPDGSVIKEGQPPRYPMQKVPNATYGPNTNAM